MLYNSKLFQSMGRLRRMSVLGNSITNRLDLPCHDGFSEIMQGGFPLKALPVCVAMVALVGCGGGDGGAGVCTDEVRPAVSVVVLDQAGQPLGDAFAQYRVNGSGIQDADCIDVADSSMPSCHVFWAGLEVPGDYELAVGRQGYASQDFTVTVQADRCHVVTKEIEVLLAQLN